MKTLPPKTEMDRATQDRDVSYDGTFYVGVRTTGIFCRPSCPAKKPLAQNVEYLATARDALLAGYRPCKRCRPMDTDGQPPVWVEQLLSRIEESPAERWRDADLRSIGIDPTRARRYFLKHYGLTFQAYHRARRMGLALTKLRSGSDSLGVGLDHGYESASGFRDAFERIFGTSCGRSGDVGCVVTTVLESPVGPLVAGATAEGVCLLEFADRPAFDRQLSVLRKRLGTTMVPGDNEHIDHLADELSQYFSGTLTKFTVTLVVPGTAFQRAVWERLMQIPFGSTLSYGELARDLGRPGAQRAVGRANGDNRIAIVIPCHRVVQSNGELRGYGGGLWRKKFLLDHEREVILRRHQREPEPANAT